MYAIHTTPGLIIGSRPSGEAGKLLSIFTRDFGLVLASAQGIRLEKSKLRYYIQDFSSGIFSLVRGKEFWRLTSAAGMDSQTGSIAGVASPARALIARIALLLRRLLHGEEANPELFQHVSDLTDFLSSQTDSKGERLEGSLNEERLKTLESLIVLRMLHSLGYVGKGILPPGGFSIAILDDLADKRLAMNQHINKALKESHL